MDKTLKVINDMKKNGVIKNYAISGAIAVLFYTEPFFTEDLDIMFVPVDEEKSKIAPLSPIYAYLVEEIRIRNLERVYHGGRNSCTVHTNCQ